MPPVLEAGLDSRAGIGPSPIRLARTAAKPRQRLLELAQSRVNGVGQLFGPLVLRLKLIVLAPQRVVAGLIRRAHGLSRRGHPAQARGVALGAPPCRQDHARVLLAHLIEGRPDPGVVAVVDPARGSNVHYLLVRALEQAGVGYTEIQPVFLPPADARAAFERGAVDAWVIWDPFQAAAEAATGARTIADGTGLVANHQFYVAERAFADAHGDALDAVIDAIAEIDAWAKGNTDAVAAQLSPAVGIPAPILAVALKRQTYGVKPLDPAVVAEQQRIADTLHSLGLLPKPVVIADAVRKAGS